MKQEATVSNKLLSYTVEDGIAMITIDMVDYPTNLLSFEFITEYVKIAQKAIQDEAVKGIIVTSGQYMFMPGADLRVLAQPVTDPEVFFKQFVKIHQNFRKIELSGKPFVAAINGNVLGGGLELTLTCHHRVVLNNPKIKIGFPEIKLGLLPGAGGTAKAPYLLGIQNTFNYLLTGLEVSPEQALKDNLVDALADTPEALIESAKTWILNNPNPVQPWDNKKAKIPGGGLMTPNGAQTLMGAIGNVRKKTHGNYPSAQYLMSVVHDGLNLPIDRALEVEARYFTKAMTSKEARNQIRTGFFFIQEAAKGKRRPQKPPYRKISKLGILGAGMMGAGIAYVSAMNKIEVVLKDTTLKLAEKGKAYTGQLLQKRIARGKMTPQDAEKVLARIKTTTEMIDIKNVDYVVEAVFENPSLKASVIKEAEEHFDKIFGSNTSTLPITMLAKASKRPANFIGIHFFSPVDKMPLVEVIVGKETSEEAIAGTIDYILAIRKIPIVVNDGHGFYTTRCFTTYTMEGIFLLEEGIPAAVIENIAKKTGLPVGPLAVTDEVSLSLSLNILKADPRFGKDPEISKLYKILNKLVNENGRSGKKSGQGFYDYPSNSKKKLWAGLKDVFPSKSDVIDEETITKRLLHRQALEAYRCLDEGVLSHAKDGDIGSILGWGFPIYTGGVISYIDYVGVNQFVVDCDDFCRRFGDRFRVPKSLRQMAKEGKTFY